MARSGNYVHLRIDRNQVGAIILSATKVNLTKVRDTKLRVLASSATFYRLEGPQDRRAAAQGLGFVCPTSNAGRRRS
jgi:hypothetical protein